MKSWKKRIGIVCAGVLIAAAAVLAWFLANALPIGTGYVAKYLCTSTFVSLRDPDPVFREDITPVNPLARAVSYTIDRDHRSVTATALGIISSTAVYRDGCGCTLAMGATARNIQTQTRNLAARAPDAALPSQPDALPWPDGNGPPSPPADMGVDPDRLAEALDEAFAEPSSDNPRKTRAVLVVYQGRLIAERYAEGFHAKMPLPGWSMAKSITNAIVGILVRQGRLSVMKPAPVPEWQTAADPRQKITLDQLLRMSSGLAFDEVYAPLHHATEMLYGAYDMAAFAAAQPLAAEPDTVWNYSSGTANIIAGIVRRTLETDMAEYYPFLHQELFNRIGMTSAVMESDPSGTFVGSSYAVATPRDWARFGLLYLRDGVWNSRRILPEGWVAYSTTPTPAAPRGEYGALFWLNAGARDNPGNRRWPDAPADAYAAKGFQEQKVIIIPSRDLVLVRFGATADRSAWDTNRFIRSILDALPGSASKATP